MDFDGKVLLEEQHDVNVAPLTSKVYLDWPLEEADAGRRGRHLARLRRGRSDRGRNTISRNLTYLAPTKEVHLKPAHLTVDTTGANGNYTIRVTSPVLARSVYLSFGNLDVKLSDNYFDLLPGETVEITASTSNGVARCGESAAESDLAHRRLCRRPACNGHCRCDALAAKRRAGASPRPSSFIRLTSTALRTRSTACKKIRRAMRNALLKNTLPGQTADLPKMLAGAYPDRPRRVSIVRSSAKD